DFIICIASRAVAEKGWQEAVDAVTLANASSKRVIQLIMVGDGPEYERLNSSNLPNFIHLLGFQVNVRDFFNIADVGLITSTFRGESCPLVLIECLSVGKPVIASDIGEVSNMLATKTGMAGRVHQLNDWAIDVEEVAKIILDLSNSLQSYNSLKAHVLEAFSKFDHNVMIDNYIKVYE
ncbi:glycosyltransferase family 4 protein, partial [Methylobacterium sp. WL8]|uniref:glycosyltransferase family 4 protein n=1 Tax=Methylobacterium sp. WL8 TaxID=2603899 RepID=UPI0011C7069D